MQIGNTKTGEKRPRGAVAEPKGDILDQLIDQADFGIRYGKDTAEQERAVAAKKRLEELRRELLPAAA